MFVPEELLKWLIFRVKLGSGPEHVWRQPVWVIKPIVISDVLVLNILTMRTLMQSMLLCKCHSFYLEYSDEMQHLQFYSHNLPYTLLLSSRVPPNPSSYTQQHTSSHLMSFGSFHSAWTMSPKVGLVPDTWRQSPIWLVLVQAAYHPTSLITRALQHSSHTFNLGRIVAEHSEWCNTFLSITATCNISGPEFAI